MGNNLRTCAVCMRKYQFCSRRKEDVNKEMWHYTFCSQDCHDIYDTTSKFEDGRISKNTAKKQLNKLDLSRLDSFGESYKKSISKIMSVKNTIEVSTIENIENTSVCTPADSTENIEKNVDMTIKDKIKGIENNSVKEEKSVKMSRSKKVKMLNSDLYDFDREHNITI